ncbi:MAG: aminotransferase class I/II-fold pyridoxal phosphate-dependent enzyme [Deltaproteobacteria bacterium]|nr:aminotransferase class I/II-fold pyridoxal phosphate-dependent enzyme [Deltaproteobacteria bacterium]
MREDFLPLSRPSIGEEEINRVVACLKSGWITTGPLCQEFEEKFRRLTGAKYAVSVSSATAGMHLALLALGISAGDEVITPSMTFASTINMITLLGARPVFVDIDYGTLNINAVLIEEKITGRTKALIPVHFAGAPADMDKIGDIARKHDLVVIEDAAHAAGTYYKGVPAGGFGSMAIFSFHPLKNITSGEGGMITHNDDELEKHLRSFRFHGIERDAWKRYGKGGNPDYDINIPGFKYNLPDMQAALGLAQLARLSEFNSRRAELVAIYRERLAGLSGLELPGSPVYAHDHAWHLFIVKVLAMSRERLMEKLSDYNIGYGLHFPACHRLSYVKKRFGSKNGELPETERAAGRILSLPLFPGMEKEDVHYVCEALREIFVS